MKQVLRDLELPGTGETPPRRSSATISRWKNDLVGPEEAERPRRRLPRNSSPPRRSGATRRGSRTPARSTSTTCCYEALRLFERGAGRAGPLPGALALPPRRRVPGHQPRAVPVGAPARRRSARNLSVVGDDDQSIYGWRGADVRNILDFERDYPDATVVKLEQNYRSTQLILDAAHAVVSRNEAPQGQEALDEEPAGRADRALRGRPRGRGGGVGRPPGRGARGGPRRGRIGPRRRADEGDERLYSLRDVAIMYRTNAQRRAIEEAFLRYGLRYQLVGGTRFYQRREVKDALAYLRVLRNDRDVAAFERIVNVPARGVGEKTLEAIRARAAANGGDVWEGTLLGSVDDPAVAGPVRPGRLRRPGPPPADARRPAGAPRPARRGPRGVGLPRAPRRRHRGGSGAMGEPARAARGRRALRRPRPRRRSRPPPRGDGAGRRPGHLTAARGCSYPHHPPRR